MSGHDWNSDADHHDEEGQDPALTHHVDYGQAHPSEPATHAVEPSASESPEDSVPDASVASPKRGLKLSGNPLKQIPKVKRETRVGVAAMLSFVILVTAFIVNKNRSSNKAAAEKPKGAAAAPVVAIKYEPEEPKVLKAPPRELEGDASKENESTPAPTPPDSAPVAAPVPSDPDSKAIVLASADGPPPSSETKPVGEPPKSEVLPPPSSPPPTTTPVGDPPKPTPTEEKKDELPALPPSALPTTPEPPKTDPGTPLPPIQELKPPDEKSAAAPPAVPEVKDSPPKDAPAAGSPAPAAPPVLPPMPTPDSKAPGAPVLPALPGGTDAPPAPSEPKPPVANPPAVEAPKPPESAKPAPDPAKPAADPAKPPQGDGPPPLNVLEPPATPAAPPVTAGPPAVLPTLPLNPSPLEQKPVAVTPPEPPKAATTPEPKKADVPAIAPSPSAAAPPASEVLPPTEQPKPAGTEPPPSSPFPNTPAPGSAPREIVSTPASPFDASQPRTITSIPQSEGMPAPTAPSPATNSRSMPLEPGWKTLKKVGKSSMSGAIDAEPLSTRPSIPDAPPPREDRTPKEDIEPVLHTVQRGENFWTVSRLYYGSGRYYRALWSYNRGKVPDIKELYVGTTIKVPPPEMLDRSLIESPSMASSAGSAPQSRTRTSAPAATRSAPSDSEVRTVPMSRSRNDSRPDLALGNPVSRAGREDVDPPTRPVYRIRPNDTLRGIAKQTLGDAKRDREILELNRGLIDDPRRLTPGQTIILPSDATVTSRGR